MQYQTTIKKDGNYADLVFTRKNGETEEIHLGHITGSNLADQCLCELYGYHQCNDEFKDDDTIIVPEVGTFVSKSFHIMPADEDTKFACMGVTKENPFRITYKGMDGNASKLFTTQEAAVAYIKERWMGVDYMDSRTEFHTDYGRYTLFGFTLSDIGKVTGQGIMRDFTFQSDCSHEQSLNAVCVKCGKKLFEGETH